MKIIEDKQEQELKAKIKARNIVYNALNAERTSFLISMLWVLLEVGGIQVALWLLTSPDVSFRPLKISWPEGILAGFIALVTISLLTTFSFCIKGHQIDQFAINYGFYGVAFGFYLSSFWFGDKYFLYQSLIALAFLVLFLFIGTALGVLVKNYSLKLKRSKVNHSERV